MPRGKKVAVKAAPEKPQAAPVKVGLPCWRCGAPSETLVPVKIEAARGHQSVNVCASCDIWMRSGDSDYVLVP